jgi:hypothetical protein
MPTQRVNMELETKDHELHPILPMKSCALIIRQHMEQTEYFED